MRYKLAYRKYAITGQWSWAETETSDLFLTLSNLEPATEYEIKVGVPCNSTAPLSSGSEVVYTPSQRATTLAAGQLAGIECGKEPTIDLSKQTLLPLLKTGDVVMANDFPTTITRVTGTSQGWSGEGWTKVPLLGDTRIHVTYASIKVNSDYKLIDGSFITTYDPTGKNIGDIDKTIDDAVGLYTGGTDVGKVVTGTDATAYTVPYTITSTDIADSKFTTDGSGGGTITLGNGQTLAVSSLPTTIQDAAGSIYQADDKGKLTKVGSNNSSAGAMLATANLTVVDASKGTVAFAPTSDMKYAFDAWQKAYDGNSTWSKRYETLPISGQSGKYRVSSKLMVPGEADKVLAIINLNDKSLVADSVRFVNAKGTLFEKKKITNNSCELSLVGGPAGDAQEVYALYSTGGKTYTLGKLLVATYEPKTINLALVPVNDAVLDSKTIAEELQKVYEPLGIDFNLTTKAKFEYEALKTAPLNVEGSGLLSVYTEQMKALNNAYATSPGSGYDTGTVYMFALKQGAGKDQGKTILGDMPRGKQFGYIFTDGQTGEGQGTAAAHEIGHGVFQLEHTFSYSGMADATFSATNVMNYPAGEALSKLQWDLMHDPGLVISVFETDKGAEMGTVNANELIKKYEEFAASYPNGLYLALHGYTCSESSSVKKFNKSNPEFPNTQILYSITIKTANGAVTAIVFNKKDDKIQVENQILSKDELAEKLKGKFANTDNFLEFYTKQNGTIKALKKCDNWGGLKDEVCALVKDYSDESYHLYIGHVLDQISACKAKNVMLFVNGYRGITEEPTKNLVEKFDSKNYWEGIDMLFRERRKSSYWYYADGHMGISTSNHKDELGFFNSIRSSYCARYPIGEAGMALDNIVKNPIAKIVSYAVQAACASDSAESCFHRPECVMLNTKPNTDGYDERSRNGRVAGSLFVKYLKDLGVAASDTLDIVCHSMGFAYAQGMIEVIKDSYPDIHLGGYYILAPENACTGTVNPSDWDQIWQYGTDEDHTDKWMRDGVAPQCPLGNIGTHRAYIPETAPQGFVESHLIKNYIWVFKREINDKGYVTPRE